MDVLDAWMEVLNHLMLRDSTGQEGEKDNWLPLIKDSHPIVGRSNQTLHTLKMSLNCRLVMWLLIWSMKLWKIVEITSQTLPIQLLSCQLVYRFFQQQQVMYGRWPVDRGHKRSHRKFSLRTSQLNEAFSGGPVFAGSHQEKEQTRTLGWREN